MTKAVFGSLLREPEVSLMGKLTVIENTCLVTIAAVVAADIVEWFLPETQRAWPPMSSAAATAVLLTALSLFFSRGRLGKHANWLSRALALLVVLSCGCAIAAQALLGRPGWDVYRASHHPAWFLAVAGISPQSAAVFGVLGLTVALVRMRQRGLRRVADFLAFCSALMVLVLFSGHLIAVLRVFGKAPPPRTAAGTLLCLVALTVVMFIRRAQHGFFSVLFGRGIGSKVARLFAPIFLVAPFLREVVRARLIDWHRMPPNYETAVLASAFVAIGTSMLLYLAWRLNTLEAEIHALSLRDPLTGLYNLRGFRLLADQMLLVARRSDQPFSVIFLDLDNLKEVNDALGHQAGSALLVATATILKNTFREADVLGRIGGDEFAVAGQFSAEAVREAARRLQEIASERHTQGSSGLSFSAGCVTSDPGEHTPLVQLLAQADVEMYREKRRKKAGLNPAEDLRIFPTGRLTGKSGKRRDSEEKTPNLFV